jgi:hypothetical protein
VSEEIIISRALGVGGDPGTHGKISRRALDLQAALETEDMIDPIREESHGHLIQDP